MGGKNGQPLLTVRWQRGRRAAGQRQAQLEGTGRGRRADVVTYSVVAGATPKAPFLKDLTTATGGELVTIKTI